MSAEDVRDRLAALVAWYESRRKNVEREIAAAVARERERCAKVAEAVPIYDDCCARAVRAIAAAIREGK